MATKKKLTKKPARKAKPRARRGPIDAKAFLRWLDFRAACDVGLAEAKHRIKMAGGYVVPALHSAANQCALYWPTPDASGPTNAPCTAAYLRWVCRKVQPEGSVQYWADVNRVLTDANIRRAMKIDGIVG